MSSRTCWTMLGVLVLGAPALAMAQPAEPTPPPPAEEAAPAGETTPATTDAPPAEVAQTGAVGVEPATATTSVAPEETPPETRWYDTLQVNAFASIAYSYNTNRPADDANQLRVFDTDDGSVNVDVVEVVVQKPASAPGEAGFRVDVVAGSTVPAAEASAGLFRDADGNAQDVDLQQGFVSYIAEIGDGLRIDAGKFVTHMGYEVIEGYDGYNDHYSRSLLFGYAIPFTHTGVKASYPITPQLTGMLTVVNGWDNVKDNNSGKTFGAMLNGVFGPATTYLCYIAGPEQENENGNWRQVLNAIVSVKPVEGVTVAVDADYGAEPEAVMTGDAQWYGAALYGKYELTPVVALAVRGEAFRDDDGARTGAAQTLYEATFTPTFKISDNFVLRGDLRFDKSNVESYVTDDEMDPSKQQLTIAINALGIL